MKGKDHSGYSLIEMTVIIVLIMGLFLAVVAPFIIAYLEKSRATACLAIRYQTEKAETAFALEKGSPSSSFADLVNSGLLSEKPRCPSHGLYIWLQRMPAPVLGCSRHYAMTPLGEEVSLLLSDSFNDQSQMKDLVGNWYIDNGSLVNEPGQENRIAFGNTTWDDYKIKVSAVLSQGNGYGIYYRADGNPNITGYVFQYNPGLGNRFLVRKVYGGREQSPLQSVAMPANFPVYNQSHDISITVIGDHTVIQIDNQTIMDFRDTSFTSGSGGFQTWKQAIANFDNLSVAQQ